MEKTPIIQPFEAPVEPVDGGALLERLSASLERDARLYPAPMQP